ncbi:hypothetical protein [Vulcanisaeta sp. JCM 16159]|uniref:hypothetical protein n=1 Tax=Vulcanisaeta sp. JCM 16159 TaxID=1295371 RepID=UPI0006D1201C|nr:hypothetical protein [Vulcanisaeta sp. JCM 16159]
MVHNALLIWNKVLELVNDYEPEDLFMTLYKGRQSRVQASVSVYDEIEIVQNRSKSRHYASIMDINIIAPVNQLHELAKQAVTYIYEHGLSFNNCQVINKAGSLTEFITNLEVHNDIPLEDALSMIKGLLSPFRNVNVYLSLGTRRDKNEIEVRGNSHLFTDGKVRVWSVHRHANEFTFLYEVVPRPRYIIQVEPPMEEDEGISIIVRSPQEYWTMVKRAVVSVVGRRNVEIGDLDKIEREEEEQEEERLMRELMREEEENRILPEWECGEEYGEE